MAWTEFKTRDKGQPGARECHSMVAVGQVLYLFGGNDRTQRFNDLRGFDTGEPSLARLAGLTARTSHATILVHFSS